MRKILIAFSVGLLAWQPDIQAQNITLTVSSATIEKGQEVLLDVSSAEDLSASDILAYQLTFRYDPNVLLFVGAEKTGTLMDTWANPTVNSQTIGLVKLAGANATEIAGPGILFKLRFTSVGTPSIGGTYVYLDAAQTNYFNEGLPTASSNNGLVTVNATPQLNFSPESGVLFIGETTTVTAYSGTAPYNYSVSNTDIASINSSGVLTGLASGKTRVKAVDANNVNDSTTGFFDVYGLRLSTRDTTSLPTKTKRIPIKLENVEGVEILSGQFQIDVYSYIFSNVAVVTTGSLLSGGQVSSSWSNNKLSISFANATALTASGILCYLDLTGGPTATGQYLTFSNIVFNENITALKKDNYYQISPFATITLSGGAPELISGETTQFNISGGRAPYTWSSSNESVLMVDANSGLVTALGGGVAYVTATDADGAKGNSTPITVKDIVVSVVDTMALEISTIDIPIRITAPAVGKEIGAFQGKLTYNTNYLIYDGLVSAGSLSSGWSLIGNESTPGTVTFAGAGANEVSQAGDLFYARFTLKYSLEVGMNTTVTLSEFIFNEGVPTHRLESGTIEAFTNCPEDPLVALTVNGDLSICMGQDFNVTLSATDSADYTYAWFKDDVEIPNTDAPDYNITEVGIYKVRVTTSANCFNTSSQVSATVNPYPTSYITYNNDSIICLGETVYLYANTNIGTSYQWMKDGQDISGSSIYYHNATEKGLYQVRSIASSGCYTISDPINIQSGFEASISAQSATEFCQGKNVILQSDVLDGDFYQWYLNGASLGGQNASSISASQTGNFTLRVTKSGCVKETNAIGVLVNAYPNVEAGNNLEVCEDFGQSQLMGYSPAGGSWAGPFVSIGGMFDANTAGAGNYTLTYTVNNNGCESSDSLQISVQSQITVQTSNDTTLIFDGSTLQLQTNTLGGTWTGTGVYASGLFDPNQSGIGEFTLFYNVSTGVCSGFDSTVVTVNKGNQSISVEAISDKTIIDNFFGINASGGASGQPLVFTALTSNISLNGNQVTLLGTGTATIRVSQMGNEFYNAAQDVEISFQINTISQTLSVTAIPDKTYGDADFAVSVIGGNSGQPITYTALTSNISLSGNQVTITGTGLATVRVSQAGNTFYTAAPDVEESFIISKINQTISVNAITDKTYGDADFSVTATGGASGEPLVYTAVTSNITVSGNTVSIIGVGNTLVRVSQAGNNFYNAPSDVEVGFLINKANQNINFASLVDKTFGDANFTVSATGGASGNPVTLTAQTGTISITGNQVSIVSAGAASIRASQAGNEFYNAAVDVDRNFTINRASQTITFEAITDKLDGDADFDLVASSSQILTLSYNILDGNVSIAGNTVSINGPGNVTIEATQSGNTNYNPAPPAQRSFCVTPVPVITLASDMVTLQSNYLQGNQWMRNGANIANATGNNFTATESGEYTLKVSFDQCTAISAESISLDILGLTNLANEHVSVYPNPAKSQINVKLEQVYLSKLQSIYLSDLNGRSIEVKVLKREDGFSIDLSSLKSGLYLLNLKGTDFQYHIKIVIE